MHIYKFVNGQVKRYTCNRHKLVPTCQHAGQYKINYIKIIKKLRTTNFNENKRRTLYRVGNVGS